MAGEDSRAFDPDSNVQASWGRGTSPAGASATPVWAALPRNMGHSPQPPVEPSAARRVGAQKKSSSMKSSRKSVAVPSFFTILVRLPVNPQQVLFADRPGVE